MTFLLPDPLPVPPGAPVPRRVPVGAETIPLKGVDFRVWAPKASHVSVVFEADGHEIPLAAEDGGWFSALAAHAGPGTLYRFRLDGGERLYPDPASRFQPDGPHGPSQVVDPSAFAWTDAGWGGCGLDRAVIYEMHIGTVTPGGTWLAAMEELPALADLGITVLEVMPVADFPGRFGWGYDGVCLFAPTRLYGTPDDMRRFIDRAHGLGMAVILDVVYNHLGPDGNYLSCFSDDYFTRRYPNEWGEAINFDGPGAGPVRDFFIANAACWVEEYHIDGLRLDATQQIFDRSPVSIVTEVARAVRRAGRGCRTLLVGENEPQDTALLRRRPPEEGDGLDALWNDDFHHAAMAALTGRNEAYYSDYLGTPQELVSAVKHGFLYQGQWYRWQKQRRGTATAGIPPAAFVTFLQNHDQIANSAHGLRGHALTTPGRWRALTAVLLLGPGTPMLFQGQEFSASAPFLYFADHKPGLAEQVARGRGEFLSQFPGLASAEAQAALARPDDEDTFARSTLDPAERRTQGAAVALHRDLLRLRREDAVFSGRGRVSVDGAVLGAEAFVLRFFGTRPGDDRLLLVNLGRDLPLAAMPEPLLAPPAGADWRVLWSSEDFTYGGGGVVPLPDAGCWTLPGHAALALAPVAAGESQPVRAGDQSDA